MLWLDHLIFGNGYGLKSPYFDSRFYWLSGRLYTWIGGFGAQLQSFQWRHPKAGESRKLCGLEFRPFHSERRWLRVRVAWATKLPADLNEANQFLRRLERDLGGLFPFEWPHPNVTPRVEAA
jgi:hypothetical protein